MIGLTISQYRIVEKLGVGGMGVVYKAEDTALKRTVALKFLPRGLAADREATARFQREAQAAASLNHPNIITIHEIGTHENQIYICMEYVEGRSLRSLIDEGPMAIDRITAIAVQMADGLAAAHSAGVIHRDLKPDNVLLTDSGRIKIVDFGLAKLADATRLTQEDTMLGTAFYMSPEQVLAKELSAAADVFSLGIVLYEMATGRLPFEGEHAAALAYSIVHTEPPPPGQLRSGLPPAFENVVMGCLEKEPDERYPHAGVVLNALRSVGAPGGDTPPGATRPPARARRLAPVLGVLALTVLVVAAGLWRSRHPPPPSTAMMTIAVLPFENLSPGEESAHFSDGVTEDIITQLSKVGRLRVTSWRAARHYRNSDQTDGEIGADLGVGAILRGSIARDGDRLRIVSRLIDAQTETAIWHETHDEHLHDIFAMQSRVVASVAGALSVTLTDDEVERISNAPTRSIPAYDDYLRGRDYYYRYERADNENAIRLFKAAIARDPEFALAYAGLSDAYAQRVLRFGFEQTWLDSAIAVGKRALAIDAALAEAYKAVGLAHYIRHEYRPAYDANAKAIELSPNLAAAVGNAGIVSFQLGRPAEALRHFETLLSLDPTLHVFAENGLGACYRVLGLADRAQDAYEHALAERPSLFTACEGLVVLEATQGQTQEAREGIHHFMATYPEEVRAYELAATLDILTGNLEEAEAHCDRAITLLKDADMKTVEWHRFRVHRAFVRRRRVASPVEDDAVESAIRFCSERMDEGDESWHLPYLMAEIHALRDQREEAERWFAKARDAGFVDYRWAEISPFFEVIRSGSVFRAVNRDLRVRMDKAKASVGEDRHLAKEASR